MLKCSASGMKIALLRNSDYSASSNKNVEASAYQEWKLKFKRSVATRVSQSDALSELEEGQIPGIAGYGAISSKPATPLLDTINFPSHLKNLSADQLEQVAKELRADLIYNVSQTGGHLGSSLGVIELTVALNYVFDQPTDKIIWDVGHQAYPHKILTGRRDRMNTIRQTDGLSPFTKRSESPFDCFGAGHSSTSISAGLGMAVARDMQENRTKLLQSLEMVQLQVGWLMKR